MINTGDRIRLNGTEATVTARHAAGKHVRFTLSDGRVVHDLDKRDDVELLAGKAPALTQPDAYKHPMFPSPIGTVEDLRDETANGEDLLD